MKLALLLAFGLVVAGCQSTDPLASKTGSVVNDGLTNPTAKDEPAPREDLFETAKSFEEGLKLAKAKHGYVVIKFEASWCVPCKVMDREFFQDEKVAKLLEKSVVVHADTDTVEGQKLAELFEIGPQIPRLEFVRPDGKSFGKVVGYANVQEQTLIVTKILGNNL